MLWGAALVASAGCAELEMEDVGGEDVATATQALPTLPAPEPCDYITCGRNTRDIGNGFVDQVFFDGSANPRGQRFLHWKTASGAPIAPRLTARGLEGAIERRSRTGDELNGSVMTLQGSGGQRLFVRFREARQTSLPNGVRVWVYHLEKRRGEGRWEPLCQLFSHSSDAIARHALVGTRELVREARMRVTAHEPGDGMMTLACPNTATGKMLSLGALRTTAAAGQEPTAAEMDATLRALTLSPLGERSYTKPGVGVMFNVARTGVDNNGEALAGGFEAAWRREGAICFDRVRHGDSELLWDLWQEARVPSCADVDLDPDEVLVRTYRYFGVYPAYPPERPGAGSGTRHTISGRR
jgi:hypothetical protein